MSRTTHPKAEIDTAILLVPHRLTVCQRLYGRLRTQWPDSVWWVEQIAFGHHGTDPEMLVVRVTFAATSPEGHRRTCTYSHRFPWAKFETRHFDDGIVQQWYILHHGLKESLAEDFAGELAALEAELS